MGHRDLLPIHPGEVLFEDFMKPMGITQYRLAKGIRVTPARIGEIVHGQRSITADTALRLARFFNMEAAFWMNLQASYDLKTALFEHWKDIYKTIEQFDKAA